MITAGQYVILCTLFPAAAFLVALIWCFSTIKNGRGFKITNINQNGTESLRYDFDLFKDMILKSIEFLLYMLLITNFVGYLLLDEWVYGKPASLGSIGAIIILLSVDTLKKYYNWVLDESEKTV